MEATAVLGLSISTRMQGLAIVSHTHLLDYHIYLRKGSWGIEKNQQIITSLQTWCIPFNINAIALSIPYEKQATLSIKALLESVRRFCSEHRITLYPYPAKTLHRFCQEGTRKTKKEGMRQLCELYPELTQYYHKELENRNKYYIKMFEAIAVATVQSQELQKQRRNRA